jgi:phosphomannomutase
MRCKGFKWLGNVALRLNKEYGYQVLFSYEEALGYCVGDVLCDKDGISASIVFAELANTLWNRGCTVSQYLAELNTKYGLFVSYNTYVFSHDPCVTNRIFSRIRTGGSDGGYFAQVGNHRVRRVRDVTLGYDSESNAANNSSSDMQLPATSDANMIMFEFDNDASVILRTSGTEPKIKCYSEMMAGSSHSSKAELETTLSSFVELCIQKLIQPHENNLSRP